MKAAISNSLFPAFGSLMHNVGFRYPDNVFHEPHFMCGLVGPMSIVGGVFLLISALWLTKKFIFSG